MDNYKALIEIGQKDVFSNGIYDAYSMNNYTLLFPTEGVVDKNLYTGPYTSRSSSIVEITNTMIKYTQNVINYYPEDLLLQITNTSLPYAEREDLLDQAAKYDYFNPLKNYDWNVLWINK